MSYKSYFNLTLLNPATRKVLPLDEAAGIIGELRGQCEEAGIALDGEGGSRIDWPWYDHDEDLKEFSKQYPHTLFELHRAGEDHDDAEYLYVLGGRSQLCLGQMVYQEYDEGKLT
jgi:hypothetical protein